MRLEQLNEKQQEAVKTIDGPLLVLAGAGSGKTRVLTTRIVYLINEVGIDPSRILAITFTNKAAKEMKERVVEMLGPKGYRIQISTFHSFGLSILKAHYDKAGLSQNFTILDSDDSLTVIKKILKEKNLDPKQYNPKAIKHRISSAKNELLDPNAYRRYAQTEFEQTVIAIYERYQEKLMTNQSVDFDDLLMMPITLFKEQPLVLKEYQEQFLYLLIDEYQDTNEAQYLLSKMIGAKHKNICVVGDNDQSIYSWRGANYRNILNFENDYQYAKVILLEENYRSTQTILNSANDIIRHNKERKEKNLWTANEEGAKIRYYRAFDEKEEATFVVDEIQTLVASGHHLHEIAILYRTNAQSRNMEEALLKEQLPYKVIGSFYFYNRKEIKDLIAYLKIIHNPLDDISLLRVINVPKRKIGLKTIERLTEQANQSHISLIDAIGSGSELSFKKIIEELIALKETASLTELVDHILDKTGMRQELVAEKTIEAEIRLENLEEFKSITASYEERNGIVSLDDFLSEISLVADMEEHKSNTDVITLMTIHSAKGLEFEYVFLIGLEEGLFPHNNSLMDSSELEEERRLCYVAITRAKKKLWFTNARRRMLYGMPSTNLPSRFIEELKIDRLECLTEKVKEEKPIFTKEPLRDVDYAVGEKIVHDTFGIGIVVGVQNKIIDIAFSHPVGIKKLIKGHKSIRKVDD